MQGRLRDEFGFIRGNVLVLLVSYMFSGLASGLYSSFRSLYIRDLGASKFVLGLLSSLESMVEDEDDERRFAQVKRSIDGLDPVQRFKGLFESILKTSARPVDRRR